MDDHPKFGLTIEEAVDRFGIGRTKIFAAMKEGRLRAKKDGRRTVIRPEDLKAFLDNLPDREVAA